MQKKDGNKNLSRSNTRNQGQQIQPRREVENRGVRDKIYRKDAIENGGHLSLLPNHYALFNSVKGRGSDGALRSQPLTNRSQLHLAIARHADSSRRSPRRRRKPRAKAD